MLTTQNPSFCTTTIGCERTLVPPTVCALCSLGLVVPAVLKSNNTTPFVTPNVEMALTVSPSPFSVQSVQVSGLNAQLKATQPNGDQVLCSTPSPPTLDELNSFQVFSVICPQGVGCSQGAATMRMILTGPFGVLQTRITAPLQNLIVGWPPTFPRFPSLFLPLSVGWVVTADCSEAFSLTHRDEVMRRVTSCITRCVQTLSDQPRHQRSCPRRTNSTQPSRVQPTSSPSPSPPQSPPPLSLPSFSEPARLPPSLPRSPRCFHSAWWLAQPPHLAPSRLPWSSPTRWGIRTPSPKPPAGALWCVSVLDALARRMLLLVPLSVSLRGVSLIFR